MSKMFEVIAAGVPGLMVDLSAKPDPAQTTLPTEADDEVTEPEATPERRIFVKEHTVPAFFRKPPSRRSNV